MLRHLPILLVACGRPGFDGLDAALIDDLQDAMEDARAEQDLPGLAVAVAHGDELWVGTTGLADRATDRVWARDDPFRIGSVTKTFTTAAILQLAAEGVVDLDDPIERWVPGWYAGPTLTHLLGHSSGIASYN